MWIFWFKSKNNNIEHNLKEMKIYMLLKKCTVGIIALTLLAGVVYNIITADKKIIEPNAIMVCKTILR